MMCEKALYQLRDFRGYKAVSATLKGTEFRFYHSFVIHW